MTILARYTAAASCTSASYSCGSTAGLLMSDVTCAPDPPICAAMSPQTLVAATTRTGPAVAGPLAPSEHAASDATIATDAATRLQTPTNYTW